MVNITDIIRIKIVSEGWNKMKNDLNNVKNEFKGFKTIGEMASEEIKHMEKNLKSYNRELMRAKNVNVMASRTIDHTARISRKLSVQLRKGIITQDEFNRRTQRVTNIQSRMRAKFNESSTAVSRYNSIIQRTNKDIKNLGANTMNATKKMDRFHAEFLSLMFFGMAMSAAMQGLLNPAMQAFGVMEMWSSTMTVMFAPMMETLLPTLSSFTDILMDLPEPVQQVVGGITVFFLVLGKLLTAFGMLGLAWFGLVQLGATFSGVMGILGTVFGIFVTVLKIVFAPLRLLGQIVLYVFGGILGAITGTTTAAIAIIVGFFVFLLLAWGRNWGNMREHMKEWLDSMVRLTKGWVNLLVSPFEILWGLIKGIFTGNWDTLKDGFRRFLNGLSDIGHGLYGIIVEPFEWLFDLLKGVIDYIEKVKKSIDDIGIGGTLKKGFGTASAWIGGLYPFAEGGIVTRPTPALIGEAGPEAVIPLDKMGGMGTTVNINNPSIRNDSDIRAIAEQVNRVLENDRRRFR